MAPTPEQTERGYHNLWNAARLSPDKRTAAIATAKKAQASKSRYQAIERDLNVPWYFVAVIHNRESAMNFAGVLHNGEHIIGTGRKTRLVPAGRGPFTTWEAAADDALKLHNLQSVPRWSVERTLFEIERYNGWGYLGKGNSPYVWSWTNQYKSGKYIADHKYSATAVDAQAGCAAIMLALSEIDPLVEARLADREPTPPPGLVKNATKEATQAERKATAAGGAGAVAAGTTKATTEAPAQQPVVNFGHTYILPLAVAIGVVVAAVAVVSLIKKANYIKSVW